MVGTQLMWTLMAAYRQWAVNRWQRTRVRAMVATALLENRLRHVKVGKPGKITIAK